MPDESTSKNTEGTLSIVESGLLVKKPTKKFREAFFIRTIDWNRIKRLINKTEPPDDKAQILFSLFWGIAGASFLSTVALWSTKGYSYFVLYLHILVCLFSLVGGWYFFSENKRKQKKSESFKDELLADISEIEKTFCEQEDE